MSDDPRRRLEEAGRRPVPEPEPAFADALEARLRAVAAGLPPAAPPLPRGSGGTFRWRLAAACLVLAALTIAVGLVAVGSRPAATTELLAPVNVVVSLADGTTIADPVGLQLPEGAVVRVGAGGSARIDDTVLGPGDVATVTGGRILVQHRPAVGVVPGVTPARSPRTTQTPAPGTAQPTPTPSRTPRPSPTPTTSPTTPITPRPTPATPRPSGTAPPTVAPTPTIRIVRPTLRARAIGHRIVVTWTATLRARTYVLVVSRSRSGPAANPVYPGSGVLGVFARPPAKPLRFLFGSRVVEVRLMVVALRRDGTVLRRSRVVVVKLPVAATAP